MDTVTSGNKSAIIEATVLKKIELIALAESLLTGEPVDVKAATKKFFSKDAYRRRSASRQAGLDVPFGLRPHHSLDYVNDIFREFVLLRVPKDAGQGLVDSLSLLFGVLEQGLGKNVTDVLGVANTFSQIVVNTIDDRGLWCVRHNVSSLVESVRSEVQAGEFADSPAGSLSVAETGISSGAA